MSSRRDEILRAAAEVFGERGYHAASVREIGSRVGILSGSLYAHIDSKEDLLYEILLGNVQRAVAELRVILEHDEPFETLLTRALRDHLRRAAESHGLWSLDLVEWRYLSPGRQREIRDLREAYEREWDGLLAKGVEEGPVSPDNVRPIKLVCLSAANWAAIWMSADGPKTPSDIADDFTAIILAGMTTQLPSA